MYTLGINNNQNNFYANNSITSVTSSEELNVNINNNVNQSSNERAISLNEEKYKYSK